jgi:hypothetical protein
MGRLLPRRLRRRSGWSRTTATASDRLLVPKSTNGATRLAPIDTASHGFAIETHVLARLLGVKLLTLEGVVLVSPAEVAIPMSSDEREPAWAPPATPIEPRGSSSETSLERASRLLRECADDLRALESP